VNDYETVVRLSLDSLNDFSANNTNSFALYQKKNGRNKLGVALFSRIAAAWRSPKADLHSRGMAAICMY
jgi:hypothetical protein